MFYRTGPFKCFPQAYLPYLYVTSLYHWKLGKIPTHPPLRPAYLMGCADLKVFVRQGLRRGHAHGVLRPPHRAVHDAGEHVQEAEEFSARANRGCLDQHPRVSRTASLCLQRWKPQASHGYTRWATAEREIFLALERSKASELGSARFKGGPFIFILYSWR